MERLPYRAAYVPLHSSGSWCSSISWKPIDVSSGLALVAPG